jgi:hypothetical protein
LRVFGNTAEKIADDSNTDVETKKRLMDMCISPDEAEKVRDYETTMNLFCGMGIKMYYVACVISRCNRVV